MIVNLKSILSGYILLELLNSFIFKLDDCAAPCANEVVMVRIVVRMFVTGKSIFESSFLRKSRLSEKFQRPVHRSVSNAGMKLLNPEKKFFSAQVLTGIDENFEDLISLGRRFEPFSCEVLCQMLCWFFLHNLILITIFNMLIYTMTASTSQANCILLKINKGRPIASDGPLYPRRSSCYS